MVVENTFDFILSWVPFYSWMRFFLHLYLILPGSQGATFLYQQYIEPFLYHHEREIDDLISQSHDRARSAGMIYVEMAIEYIKVNVLGFAARKPESPRPAGQSYAQNLMGRFQMPSARGSNDLYGLVNQALSGASALYGTTGNKDAQAADLSRGAANLVPDSIRSPDDRLTYVASQRQRLETLLQAFDREQDNIRSQQTTSGGRYHDNGSSASLGSGLSRNRSEAEFDRIERDELSSGSERPPYPLTPPALGRRTSSGWMPWNWQQKQQEQQHEDPLAYGREPGDSRRARASGFDLGDR